MTSSRQLTLITTLGVLFLMYCGTPRTFAQTVSVIDTLLVQFRSGWAELEIDYADNDRQIVSFRDRYQARTSGMELQSMQIDIYPGASSGELAEQDSTLRDRRARAIYYFLWDSLRLDFNRVRIRHDALVRELPSLAEEQPWAAVVLSELVPKAPDAVEPEPSAPASFAPAARLPFMAVTTNLLYDAALIPNIGVEITLGGRWSLTADWNYAWWSNTRDNKAWQTYGGYLGVRHYFGRIAKTRRFSGHFLGLYGDALTYDFELGGTGYQAARWGFGGGVEYGFSLPLNRSLNLDFSLGLGFQDGDYMTYEPRDGHFVWTGTYKRMWVGPTKAQVGLKWILGKQEKEGKR